MSSIATMTWTDAMPADRDEKQFFKKLGARIAERRKAQTITQVQFAEALGISQQTVTANESGRRRMSVSTLPFIARFLGTTVEELIGEPAGPGKRGPTPKWQQKVVMEMLDGLLAQASR